MNINLKETRFFSRRYFKLVLESGQFILNYVDMIKPLPNKVNVFSVINNKKVIKDLVNTYDQNTDDGVGLQIIHIATLVREITSPTGSVELDTGVKKIKFKFFKEGDFFNYKITNQ